MDICKEMAALLPSWRLDLKDKAIPSDEQSADHPGHDDPGHWWACARAAGTLKVAVDGLRDKIVDELGRNLELVAGSDDVRQKYEQSNLSIRRAFHDSLGVRNVVFIFCDDLLTRVYRAPWYANADSGWKETLDELFRNELGIDPSCVIRCLLAALPPGADIPPHHDTGLWALHSHRVHVPLFTSGQEGEKDQEVVFRVGPRLDAMVRVPFPVGLPIELNNRSKHAVANNWDQYRIHLILDYVERDTAETLDVVDLAPGQVVRQTRRAIFLGEEDDESPENDSSHRALRKSPLLMPDTFAKAGSHEDRVKAFIGIAQQRDRTQLSRTCRRYTQGEMHCRQFLEALESLIGSEGIRKAVEDLGMLTFIAKTDHERASALLEPYNTLAERRSSCAYVPRAPRFVIIGVMKCGTTSLYEYINEHPKCVRAKSKETHYFDWKWDMVQKLKPLEGSARAAAVSLLGPEAGKDEKRVQYTRAFNVGELLRDASFITGEATPSYILGGKNLAQRLKNIAGDEVRIIVTLRDPVKRAYSHYNMTADDTGTDLQKARRGHVSGKSFENLLNEDFKLLAASGISEADASCPTPGDFEDKYLSKLPQGHGGHSYVGRGIYWLQLKLWMEAFPNWKRQFHFVLLENMSSNPDAELEKIWKFLGLDTPQRPRATKAHNARSYKAPMKPETEARLCKFYAPHNKKLAQLLGIELSAWS